MSGVNIPKDHETCTVCHGTGTISGPAGPDAYPCPLGHSPSKQQSLLDRAADMLRIFSADNPRWLHDNGELQDPLGVHQWLADYKRGSVETAAPLTVSGLDALIAEADKYVLPVDVKIGAATFRQGVKVGTMLRGLKSHAERQIATAYSSEKASGDAPEYGGACVDDL